MSVPALYSTPIIVGFNFRLARLPSDGGTPIPVTELGPGEIVHRWPRILPGGKAVLFSAYRSLVGLDGATIDVVSLKDGRRKTVVRGGTWGRYLPSGHLVYINQGNQSRAIVQEVASALFAACFDYEQGRMKYDDYQTSRKVYEQVLVDSLKPPVKRISKSADTNTGYVAVGCDEGQTVATPTVTIGKNPQDYASKADWVNTASLKTQKAGSRKFVTTTVLSLLSKEPAT